MELRLSFTNPTALFVHDTFETWSAQRCIDVAAHEYARQDEYLCRHFSATRIGTDGVVHCEV